MQPRETTVEPEVKVPLTPHWTVRNVVHLFCSFHFICTLLSKETRQIRERCPWTVLASFYSFTGLFIHKAEHYLSVWSQQLKEISTKLRKIWWAQSLCAFLSQQLNAFQSSNRGEKASIRIIYGVIKVCWLTCCCTGYFLEWYLFHLDLFSFNFESKSKSYQEEDRGCRHVNNIRRLKMRMFIN